MYKFSKKSADRLATCHKDLQSICNELIKETDFTVLCGYRDKEEQDAAFARGASKLKFPDSKHNSYPSRAVDIAPYPIDWNNHVAFKELAAHFIVIADRLKIKVRWGGTFVGLADLPHMELM